jgi:hypothetical protein
MTRTYTHEEIIAGLEATPGTMEELYADYQRVLKKCWELQATISRLTAPVTEGELNSVGLTLYGHDGMYEDMASAITAFLNKRRG